MTHPAGRAPSFQESRHSALPHRPPLQAKVIWHCLYILIIRIRFPASFTHHPLSLTPSLPPSPLECASACSTKSMRAWMPSPRRTSSPSRRRSRPTAPAKTLTTRRRSSVISSSPSRGMCPNRFRRACPRPRSASGSRRRALRSARSSTVST